MDLRLGCQEPRLDGGGKDDLGETGLGPSEDPSKAAGGTRVESGFLGEIDLVRGPLKDEGVGRAGTEGLVNPRRIVPACLGKCKVCGGLWLRACLTCWCRLG
jgi:hypothetical protein